MTQTKELPLQWSEFATRYFEDFLENALLNILGLDDSFRNSLNALMNTVVWDYESGQIYQPFSVLGSTLRENSELKSMLEDSNRSLSKFSLTSVMLEKPNRDVLLDMECYVELNSLSEYSPKLILYHKDFSSIPDSVRLGIQFDSNTPERMHSEDFPLQLTRQLAKIGYRSFMGDNISIAESKIFQNMREFRLHRGKQQDISANTVNSSFYAILTTYYELVMKNFLTSGLFDSLIYVTVPMMTSKARIAAVIGLYVNYYKSQNYLVSPKLRKILRREGSYVFGQFQIQQLSQLADTMTLQAASLAEQAARASLIARNASHNIGSHVLTSGGLLDAYKWEMNIRHQELFSTTQAIGTLAEAENKRYDESMRRLDREHSKLCNLIAERWDMSAQTISERTFPSEPLSLYADILAGFFDKHIYLSYLIKDLGWGDGGSARKGGPYELNNAGLSTSGRELKFCIHWPGSGRVPSWFIAQPPSSDRLEWGWSEDKQASEPSSIHEILVGIPGGMTGRQLLFDILENWIRNSAKYGKESIDGNLDVHLSISDEGEYYSVHLWDSRTYGKRALDKLNNALRTQIIDDSLRLSHINRGMLEIKECAKILGNYSSDDKHPIRVVFINCDNQITFATHEEISETSLMYVALRFRLQKPRLLGIVGMKIEEEARLLATRFGVHYCDSNIKVGISKLVDLTPMIGIIIASDGQLKSVLEEVAKYETRLPFRLLVVQPANTEEDWGKEALQLYSFVKTPEEAELHPRRLVFCKPEELRCYVGDSLTGTYPTIDTDDSDLKSIEIKNAVLRLYELWLAKYFGKPLIEEAKWNLLINFDRTAAIDGDSFLSSWQDALPDIQFYIMNVHIFKTIIDVTNSEHSIAEYVTGTAEIPGSEKLYLNARGEACLLYDNHKKLYDSFAMKRHPPHRLIRVGGQHHLGLFNLLAKPPKDKFILSFLLLGLYEAAQLRVLIVDERVAEYVICSDGFVKSTGQEAGTLLGFRNDAAVDLAFSFVQNKLRIYLSDAIEYTANYLHCNEGIQLAALKAYIQRQGSISSSDWVTPDSSAPIDVIVVHRGIVDRLKNKQLWKFNEGRSASLTALKQFAPAVVITSGSGAGPDIAARQMPPGQRFVDFSGISQNLYPEFSKYHLSRILLGSHGS